MLIKSEYTVIFNLNTFRQQSFSVFYIYIYIYQPNGLLFITLVKDLRCLNEHLELRHQIGCSNKPVTISNISISNKDFCYTQIRHIYKKQMANFMDQFFLRISIWF